MGHLGYVITSDHHPGGEGALPPDPAAVLRGRLGERIDFGPLPPLEARVARDDEPLERRVVRGREGPVHGYEAAVVDDKDAELRAPREVRERLDKQGN